MGKKSIRTESFSEKEEGGPKLDAIVDDAMDIGGSPAPSGDLKKSAAEARAERAARRKQRREELASQGHSVTSSLASTPNPEAEPVTPAKPEKKLSKSNKMSTTEKPEREEVEVEIEAPAAAPELATPEVPAPAEALPCVIDIKPSKPAVANAETHHQSASERDTSVALSTVNRSEGPNRAARRRLMQIQKQRAMIKKDLGIPAESNERQLEVDTLLAAWTAKFDEKTEARVAKKAAKKRANKAKGDGKLQGRNRNNEEERQMKKQKQKKALRVRQEAVSVTSLPEAGQDLVCGGKEIQEVVRSMVT